ncbi:membrane-associated protein, putative [Bodo saltans]|uniref:Membrane-associated protein, putative n=1 Tax=Bodo saltans TaxID=75058 RepID=A0A0S4JAP9_BODSA|nr:membrane-associated protein, putative [Bodo saltans]|eukprot:CUG87017.1 membrane-associated protein, putative [Bodo saltans]
MIPRIRDVASHRTSLRSSAPCFPSLLLHCMLTALVVVLHVGHVPVTEATTTLPLPSVPFTPFAYSQPLLTFAFNAANINVNQEVLGMTLQIALDDCTQGSRWFLRPLQYLSSLTNISSSTLYGGASPQYGALDSAWDGLDVIYDPLLCAVFVFKGNASTTIWSSSTASTTSVSTLLQAVRTLWFYNAAAAVVSPTVSLRVAWSFWMGASQMGGFSISVANTQHMFSCLDRSGTPLDYGSAVTACQQWLQDTADSSSIGASIVSIGSYTVQAMVQSLRQRVSAQYTDPSTGSLVGYVNLIGLYGTRSSWDNGISLSYRNFAQANPVGNFPTVMDQNGLWKSVLAADPYSYCCETTANGPPQEIANGFVTVVGDAAQTAVANTIPGVSLAVWKSTTDLYFGQFYPFQDTSAVLDAITRSMPSGLLEPVYGITASFHREDCDGAFRFVLDSNFPNSSFFQVSFKDDLCSVTLTPSSASGVLVADPSWYLNAIGNMKVIDIRGPSQAALSSTGNISKRLVWGFYLGDSRTSWVIGGSPVPHYYYCSWGSLNFADASAACANLAGGRQEGYLATPQYAWEQELFEDLLSRGNLTYDNVWIGLDTSIGSTLFSNGDPMLAFTQWGVNQPSLSDSPAAFSGINAEWASRSRESTLSYCCEMTSVVSRNLSGVIYNTLASSAQFAQSNYSERPVSVTVAQELRLFRPFADLSQNVPANLLTTLVYGVSIQLPIENCTTEHAPAGASLPLLAVTEALASPFSLCPAQPGSGVSGTTAAGCSTEKTELMQQRANVCSWILRRTDSSSVAMNASTLFAIMETLELRIARLPLDPSKTSEVKGRWTQPVELSWALWFNPPTDSAGHPELPISPSVVFRGTAAAWPSNRMTVSANTGAMFLCPSPHALGDAGGMILSTFADALTTCRDWADDAYLATVSSAEELNLLMLARNLSYMGNLSSITSATSPPAMWVGLQRNRSAWMNGDAVTYTHWAAGEPSGIGPTLVDGGSGGLWRNVPVLITGTTTQQQATFCCKRNGYNQQTARLTGLVSIDATTFTITDTISTSTSDDATVSEATRPPTFSVDVSETRKVPTLSVSSATVVPGMNGDAVTYTHWAAGEPSGIGPTLVDGGSGGLWRNVPVLITGTTTQQQATFCCKRNGYNQQTARLTGLVSIDATTFTITDTISTSTSDDATVSEATRPPTFSVDVSETRKVPTLSESISKEVASVSRNIGDSVTHTVSRPKTTSAQLTTPPPTWTTTSTLPLESPTPSFTRSLDSTNVTIEATASRQALTISVTRPTLTLTMPLPAMVRVDWEYPLTPQFTAADMRSSDPSRRRITLDSVFTTFVPVLNGNTSAVVRLSSLLSLTVSNASVSLQQPTPYDFVHTGGGEQWLGASNIISVDATVGAEQSSMSITLAQVKDYFPGATETLVLRIHRNATTMLNDQLPVAIPDLVFRVLADDPIADASVGAKSVETVFAVLSLAAPAAVRDIQFLTLLGGNGGGAPSRCSRPQQRTLYLDGIRVVSPVFWSSSSFISLWVGASAITFAVMLIHFIVWASHAAMSSCRERKAALLSRQHRQRNANYRGALDDDFDETKNEVSDDDDDDPFASVGRIPPPQQQQQYRRASSFAMMAQQQQQQVEDSSSSAEAPAASPSSIFLRFPSITVLALRLFLTTIVAHSIWILMSSQVDQPGGGGGDNSFDTKSVEFALGVFGLAIMGAVTLAVLFWTTCLQMFADAPVVFVPLPERLYNVQMATTKMVAPRGSWVPYEFYATQQQQLRRGGGVGVPPPPPFDMTRSFYWICGEYRTLWWAVVDWTLPWLLGWAATYSPADSQEDSCTQVFGAISAILFLIGVAMLFFRPLASPLANVLSAISYGLLASITICLVMQLSDPDGRSRNALNVLRWVLLVVSLLRSFVVLLSVQLAVDPYQPLPESKYDYSPSLQQRGGDDFFAVRRRSSAYALTSPTGSQRRLSTQQQQPQQVFHLKGATPMFSASHGRSQRRLTSFAGPSHQEEYDVDPMMLMEMQHNDGGGGGGYRRGSSSGGANSPSFAKYVFPHDNEDGNGDDNTSPRQQQQQHQQQEWSSGGNVGADRRRMFSVGSMSGFGSMRSRLSQGNIQIGTVDSEGESSDDEEEGDHHHHRPVVAPPQRQQQQQAPQQRGGPPPPQQTRVVATPPTNSTQQPHYSSPRSSVASPNVAMRLSGLFQSPGGATNVSSDSSSPFSPAPAYGNYHHPRAQNHRQQQQQPPTTSNRRSSDPFADIPFATEHYHVSPTVQSTHTSNGSQQQRPPAQQSRMSRLDSLMGIS